MVGTLSRPMFLPIGIRLLINKSSISSKTGAEVGAFGKFYVNTFVLCKIYRARVCTFIPVEVGPNLLGRLFRLDSLLKMKVNLTKKLS